MGSLQRTKIPILLSLTGAAVLFGYDQAQKLRWYCDDIFITLRYVENFLNGNGLVFNPGERVEGYTHFLWLLIISVFQRFQLDPVAVALNLGLISLVGTLGIFALISYRTTPKQTLIVIPFTSLALAANYEFLVWATSGLETMFFTLLLSLGFLIYFYLNIPRTPKLLVCALLLALAMLTRPDAAVLCLVAMVFLAGRAAVRGLGSRESLREFMLAGLPFVFILGPFMVWRAVYYGDLLPNTYYAKSAGLSHFSQGFYYLWLYFKVHPTSLLFVCALFVLMGLFVSGNRGKGAGLKNRLALLMKSPNDAVVFALVASAVYLVFFVARVGGDFMYARFIIPVLPFLYFVGEWALKRLQKKTVLLGVLALLMIPVFIGTLERTMRNDLLLEPGEGKRKVRTHQGILDEQYYYTHWYLIKTERAIGTLLRPYFSGLDATVLLRGQACLGYYAGFTTCIENNGLTDRFIARQKLVTRSRIGHEKNAPYEYMLKRGVNFVFRRSPYKNRPYRMVSFDLESAGLRERAEVITYDAKLMKALGDRMGSMFQYLAFDRYLDLYFQTELPDKSPAQLREDYQEFREYYFDHNDDPVRQRVFEARLGGT